MNDIKVKKHGVHIIFYANKSPGKDQKLHRLFSARALCKAGYRGVQIWLK